MTFHVGTGSVTWGNVTGSGPNTLDADPADPVDLVVQVNLAGDDTPVTYFVQPISFAAAPDAPTAVAVTPGNTQALVAFTPGADGGAPISDYAVSCSSTDGGAAASANGLTPPILVSGLTNDKTYTCALTATTATASDTSSASSAFPRPRRFRSHRRIWSPRRTRPRYQWR